MLRPKKKITKKELKHDPVVSTYQNILALYYENKKYISYATTALIVLVIAVVVYVNNRRASDEKAAEELAKVIPLYDGGQFEQAIDGSPENGIMGLRTIVDNYGGESAERARLYLADCYYAQKNYDEALKNFKSFSSGDRILESSALAGAAACYEVNGDHPSAAKFYEDAIDKAPQSPSASEYMSLAAYNYGLSGNTERAVSLYKRLKKEYATSTYAREADRYIAQFSL